MRIAFAGQKSGILESYLLKYSHHLLALTPREKTVMICNYPPVTASERSERGGLPANGGDCFGLRPRNDTPRQVSSPFWLSVGGY